MTTPEGVARERVIRRLQKAGFHVTTRTPETVMTLGARSVIIPAHDPVDPSTLRDLLDAAGVAAEDFDDLRFH